MKKYLFSLCLFFPLLLAGKELTIERLYSDPSLIGIPPKSALWSPDEEICAFLWNEKAEKTDNLYIFSAQSGFKPEKLTSFEKEGISEFCWGRSRRELIFMKGTSIFTLNTENKEVREIIESKKEKKSILLSPDQKYISYFLDGNLWLYDLAKGSNNQLTFFNPTTGEITIYLWSPDSGKIAFYYEDFKGARRIKIPIFEMEEVFLREIVRPFPGDPINERKVGVLEIAGKKIRWVSLNFDVLISLKWSRSGKKLLIEHSSEYANKRNIHITQIDNMETKSFYYEENNSQTTSYIWHSDWFDENTIILTSDRDGYCHLYSLDLNNKELKQVTLGEWEIFNICAVTRKEIYFIANAFRPENRSLFVVNLKSGKIEKIGEREGVYKPFFSNTCQNICVLFSDDITPFDLYFVKKGKLQKITSSPLPEFYEYNWIKPDYRFIESKRDSSKLRIKILVPPNFSPEKTYPAIIGSVYSNAVVNQWGGRDAHPTWGLDQYLVQVEKYILMNIDIIGAEERGYGRKRREDMLKGYGVIDIEDIESGAIYLKSLPYVNKDRIGIWGSSYGGLLTLMSLCKKPEIFRCGIAGAPASNVFHAWPNEQDVMKSTEDLEAYQNSSVYFWSQGLRAPVMIIHGIKDTTVLFMDSVSLIKKMIREGKNFEFVVLPEAEHSWDTGPSYQTIFAYKKMISFFSRYLRE